MTDLWIALALIGTTLIVSRSTICRPLQRLWPAFFACSQCVGMWVGVGVGASGLISTGYGHVLDAIIVGTATSFTAMLADAILINLLGEPEVEPEPEPVVEQKGPLA